MTRPLIYSSMALHPVATDLLQQAGRLKVASALDAETQIREARVADVIIVRAPLPAALFDDAPKLRCAIRHGAGIDMIPYDEATRAGVLIANVPGANAPTVAEHVFMSALLLFRQFRRVDRNLRATGWTAGRAHADRNIDLAGATIGIVGYGNVGREVARIAREGFGMNVLAFARQAKREGGVEFVPLDQLVSRAGIVVLCVPLTAQTRGLIDARLIGLMRKDAVLVNVSRGPVVVDDALIEALQKDRIRGAALDVFTEQPLPPDHPYFQFDNVIITPHMAGITEDSMMRMGVGAAEQAVQVLNGELPANLRNAEAVERYRSRFPLRR